MKRRKCFLWFPIRLEKYEIFKLYDDYELKITYGLICKHEEKIKLFKINDITYSRSFANFFCGVGNIIINTSDPSAEKVKINKIRKYKKFGTKLERLIFEERKRLKIVYSETNLV